MGMPSLNDHPSGGHDEGWIVSYADMMTLLFGFFVILNSFAVMDDKKFEEFGKTVAENMNGKSNDRPLDISESVTTTDREARALRLLLSMMSPGADIAKEVERIEQISKQKTVETAARQVLIDSVRKGTGKLDVAVQVGAAADSIVEISVPATTLFDAGQDVLKPSAEDTLREVATSLTRLEGLTSVEIIGHTDATPPSGKGKFGTNWALSSARAGSVAEVLGRFGVRRDTIAVRGMADLAPLFPEKDAQGQTIAANQEKNRRVSIIIKKQRPKGP